MSIKSVRIVDAGRGPQIEGNRLTVMDVFYYIHRGYEFVDIQRALPSLSRDEYDTVASYIAEHHDELVELGRRVENRIRQRVAQQKTSVSRPEIDESVPVDVRAARLRDKLASRMSSNGER